MPSPFIGLTKPAASPTATQPGPWRRDAAHRQAPRTRLVEVRRRAPTARATMRRVLVEQRVEVELLEALHRAQRTDADVHRAVAGREHPAVARAPVCRARRAATGTPRGGARRGGASRRRRGWRGRTARPGRARRRALGGGALGARGEDRQRRAVRARRRPRRRPPGRPRAPAAPRVSKRTSAPAASATSMRWVSKRCRGQTAPWSGNRSAAARRARGWSCRRSSAGRRCGARATRSILQLLERGDRSRRQPVAAHLVAPVRSLLEQRHRAPRRARRAMAAAAPAGPPPMTRRSRCCTRPACQRASAFTSRRDARPTRPSRTTPRSAREALVDRDRRRPAEVVAGGPGVEPVRGAELLGEEPGQRRLRRRCAAARHTRSTSGPARDARSAAARGAARRRRRRRGRCPATRSRIGRGSPLAITYARPMHARAGPTASSAATSADAALSM